MPHKRAKRSVREQDKAAKGADLPPARTSVEDTVPKSIARILNAGKIRQEYRENKRKHGEEDIEDGGPHSKKRKVKDTQAQEGVPLKIQPGETIAHFNKRVEHSMMPAVKSALQQSSAQARKVKKEDLQAKETAQSATNKAKHKQDKKRDSSPSQTTLIGATKKGPSERPKEFQVASTTAPRRLNDIAQAPPEFTRLPRGADKGKGKTKEITTGVLSMAQKAMMEEEREKAIRRYRELKARKMRTDVAHQVEQA
ncbi:hypothetical protein BJ138DRAFT_1146276 [Hygrophoropsis aurantiaca]|uniref:Uncharacterized protein n=1 Tax=Hygrophoropsis aurantiaca TaxID=72124 RepID=A0ACB8AJ41_9AGAM|nr:hypothetical protein BJ138DRAFT_1146276 [Hygrophoropsis aurantiaca]